MLRLRDFLSRRGDPLQLEALTGELGLDRQLPDAEVAGPGPGAGRVHRPVRPQPAARVRRDRDHLPARALGGGPADVAGEVLRVRAALHLRHQGPGGAGRDARAGAGPGRAGAAEQAQDGGVLSAGQADRRGGVRPPHHAARVAGGRVRRGPALRRTLRHREERVRARPGGAGAPAGGRRRGAGDPPGQRHPDRPGSRAGGAPHGDPRASG